MAAISTWSQPRVLRAVDVDLPLLAARAAIEIDRLISGRQTDFRNASQLGTLMQDSLASRGPMAAGDLLDPGTTTVLGNASTNAGIVAKSYTRAELIKKLTALAELLQSQDSAAKSNNNMQELQRVKRFFLALSNLSASYRQLVFGIGSQRSNRA